MMCDVSPLRYKSKPSGPIIPIYSLGGTLNLNPPTRKKHATSKDNRRNTICKKEGGE